uniref:Uncharacterized protein n=1 Tax=Otus sunia TaxID=257818 RepID=A0A8C8AE42_9STRI
GRGFSPMATARGRMAAADGDDSLYPIAVLIDELRNEDVQVPVTGSASPGPRFGPPGPAAITRRVPGAAANGGRLRGAAALRGGETRLLIGSSVRGGRDYPPEGALFAPGRGDLPPEPPFCPREGADSPPEGLYLPLGGFICPPRSHLSLRGWDSPSGGALFAPGGLYLPRGG